MDVSQFFRYFRSHPVHLRLAVSTVVVLLASSLAAHADTIFNVNANLDYGTLVGTITLNADSTAFTAIDLTFDDSVDNRHFTVIRSQGQNQNDVFTVRGVPQEGRANVYIYLPISSLTNYMGGSLCSETYVCPSPNTSMVLITSPLQTPSYFQSGSFTPAGIAPEPSSFALLGTGVLGVAGLMRKRFS